MRTLGKPYEAAVAQQKAASDEWNGWALALIEKRRILERDRTWEAMAVTWREDACVDFSAVRFLPCGYEKDEQPWPHEVTRIGHRPMAPARSYVMDDEEIQFIEVLADGRRVDFSGFIFPAAVLFSGSEFAAPVHFSWATFDGMAFFRYCRFEHEAWFGKTVFNETADFLDVIFRGRVTWNEAKFLSIAWFDGSSFASSDGAALDMNDAEFNAHTSLKRIRCVGNATFVQTSFNGRATFEGGRFSGAADFTGIKVARSCSFSEVVFERVPTFNQADFKQAPDLDGVTWPLPAPLARGVHEDIATYRALKRIAIQGHDYEREHRAFVGELRSRRLTEDGWSSAGLWLGTAYDLVSDCGRSVWKPLAVWGASILAFAEIYLGVSLAQGSAPPGCDDVVVQSLHISARNALLFFGGDSASNLSSAYSCLAGGPAEAVAPVSISMIELLMQRPLSAALLFLVLLAIRNRFRIK